MATPALATVALLATRGQRLGLALAPQARWHDLYGRQMARLELPSAPHAPPAEPQAEALALAQRSYARAASPLPTRWTYGPSPRHAVDRAPATMPTTAPFLRFERMLPRERETNQPSRLVTVEVHRALLADAAEATGALDPQTLAAIFWLPLAALRPLVSGVPLGELRGMEGVEIEQAHSGPRLPDDALLYLPSDYGERHLLRIAAKYGERALFATPAAEG